MTKARTTQSLITNAIAAAQAAGFEVGAIEVAPGGVVRILAPGCVPGLPSPKGENTCDDLFPQCD